jgi:preprotein translocase subunit SecA
VLYPNAGPLEDVFKATFDFAKILSHESLLAVLPLPILPLPACVVVQRLMTILPGLGTGLCPLHLKWVRFLSIDVGRSTGIVHMFQQTPNSATGVLFMKALSIKASPAVIDATLESTLEITTSRHLEVSDQILILQKCSSLIQDRTVPKEIQAFCALAEDIVLSFGAAFLKGITLKHFEEANQILVAFLALTDDPETAQRLAASKEYGPRLMKAAEDARNARYGRDPQTIDDLVRCFQGSSQPLQPHAFAFDGTPQFPLTSSELSQLQEIAGCMANTGFSRSELVAEGQRLGKLFQSTPSVESLGRLIRLVRFGFQEVLGKRPFLIQCCTVAALFMHFVNINQRQALKGRIAQVATGEGKSIIVAMAALISALMGNFVDVITSTQYLARRDEKAFRCVFEAFGISSSSIAHENPKRADFNGIILYGTNTDFEFAFLRTGLNSHDLMSTVPLGGYSLVKRTAQHATVDEVDNLFIDTAVNTARIGSKSHSHFDWIYRPVLDAVMHGITRVEEICMTLAQVNSVSKISNDMIRTWVSAARTALEKEKDRD